MIVAWLAALVLGFAPPEQPEASATEPPVEGPVNLREASATELEAARKAPSTAESVEPPAPETAGRRRTHAWRTAGPG